MNCTEWIKLCARSSAVCFGYSRLQWGHGTMVSFYRFHIKYCALHFCSGKKINRVYIYLFYGFTNLLNQNSSYEVYLACLLLWTFYTMDDGSIHNYQIVCHVENNGRVTALSVSLFCYCLLFKVLSLLILTYTSVKYLYSDGNTTDFYQKYYVAQILISSCWWI